MSTPEKAFGSVVREARREAGKSQEDLAFDAGVHRTYVSQIERGLKSPTLWVIVKLAAALGQKPSVLVKRFEQLWDTSPRGGRL